MRIAVGGFIHETNTFVEKRTTLDDFVNGVPNPPLTCGAALLEVMRGLNIPISGALDVFEREHVDIAPLLWCEAGPQGYVEDGAFERIATELIEGIRAAMPVDAVFLDLHGAMVTESFEDAEGELLARVRQEVGDDIPIVASLDLHGNITEQMVARSDLLYSCRKYPHTDFFETGEKAAKQLLDIVRGGQRPAKGLRQLPYLIAMPMQATDLPAAAAVYDALGAIEGETGAICSFLMGFQMADIADAGASFLAYGINQSMVESALGKLEASFDTHKADFKLEAFQPRDAVRRAIEISQKAKRPVVVGDVQDNSGGGASSDSTGMLRALIEQSARGAVIGLIFDPDTARQAHEAGVGVSIKAQIGGKHGLQTDEPVNVACEVLECGDGEFVCTGEFFKNVNPSLGPMAAVRITEKGSDIVVVVSSGRCQLADLEMLRCVGVEPTVATIIVVKSTAHFRADFAPLAEDILLALAPGELIADLSTLTFDRLRNGVELGVGGPLQPQQKQQRKTEGMSA